MFRNHRLLLVLCAFQFTACGCSVKDDGAESKGREATRETPSDAPRDDSALYKGKEGARDTPRDTFTIASSKRTYLVGEPVRLSVRYRNERPYVLRVREHFDDSFDWGIDVMISKDGHEFQRFTVASGVARARYPMVALEPGETWEHKLLLLFGCGWLPFRHPGTYSIRIGNEKSRHVPSNTITVEIVTPPPADANVYKVVEEVPLFALLQHGRVSDADSSAPKEYPRRAALLRALRVLEENSRTGYRSALRHALTRVYYHERARLPREKVLKLEDVSKLKELVGIKEIAEFADERLECKIQVDPSKRKHVTNFFSIQTGVFADMLATQAKVPLALPEELSRRTVNVSFADASTAASCMQAISDRLGAPWVQKGDGYTLLTLEEFADR